MITTHLVMFSFFNGAGTIGGQAITSTATLNDPLDAQLEGTLQDLFIIKRD